MRNKEIVYLMNKDTETPVIVEFMKYKIWIRIVKDFKIAPFQIKSSTMSYALVCISRKQFESGFKTLSSQDIYSHNYKKNCILCGGEFSPKIKGSLMVECCPRCTYEEKN